MDLIKEYFEKRGYDYEYNKAYQSRHKKIVSWQRKHKIKSTHNTASKKQSKFKLRLSRGSLVHPDNKLSKSMISMDDNKSDYSKIYSDAVFGFNEKGDEEILSWRSFTTPILNRSSGPIEKFEYFEHKTRKSFHKSYEAYFPDSTDILEDVLNLMFNCADNSFTKTIKVNTRQLGVVPDATAKYMNVKSSLWDQLHKLVKKDLETCKRFNSLPKAAFGKTFQNNFKLESKSNDFKTRWHSYSQHNAKHQDLETFSAVWKNITHLQSTRKFCMWLANNPNVAPPIFLENEGLLREDLSFDFSATSDSLYDEYVTPEEIHAVKKLALDDSLSFSTESDSSLGSVDISDINIIV